MGDAGAATSPDANALHWNTSKLAFSQKKAEISINYSPWLDELIDDIHFWNWSGYAKLGNRHALGGSITYFDIGYISITDEQGNLIREFSLNEFEFVGAYGFKLSERSALGINAKYIHSNLTGGIYLGNVLTKPGRAIASDISYSYLNSDMTLKGYDASWSLGITASNLRNKISYASEFNRDFLILGFCFIFVGTN